MSLTNINMALCIILGNALSLTSAMALPEDKNQEIHIASDQAHLDKPKGIIVYSGNVEMQQGTLNIQADKITLTRTPNGLEKIVAQGSPAHYEQVLSLEDGKTQAYGETIIFLTQIEELTLLKNAGLKKQGNLFAGDKIVYLIKEQRVKADSPTENSRIQMVIQPKQDKE